MSYCRWSTDNFRCDLYCYEDVSGGWTTHVAGRRRTPEYTDFDSKLTSNSNEYAEWGAKSFAPIGLLCDGQTFNDLTLEDFLARVTSLRGMGYIVPDSVFKHIKEEIEDERAEGVVLKSELAIGSNALDGR